MLDLEFHALNPERWSDLEDLFGSRGACGGCWCMYWRSASAEFAKLKGEGNQVAFREVVHRGQEAGILAYSAGKPVGWCAVAPRTAYPRLACSKVLRAVDAKPVWSVVCFFVAKPFRHKGVAVELLEAAVEYAKERGATIIEGYPVEPKELIADVFAYTGLASVFRKAKFVEVARRSPTRPIMRRQIRDTKDVSI